MKWSRGLGMTKTLKEQGWHLAVWRGAKFWITFCRSTVIDRFRSTIDVIRAAYK
jgi:hypothetical protein